MSCRVAPPLVGYASNMTERSVQIGAETVETRDRKSTRLNSSHQIISYAVFCLKKKTTFQRIEQSTKNQAVATSQEAIQIHYQPQLHHHNAHNAKSVHEVHKPTHQPA